MLLHVGGTSTAGIVFAVAVIFLMIFAVSFAFGAVPEGQRRFSSEWTSAWVRASLPRLIVAAAFSAVIGAGAIVGGDSSANGTAGCGRPLAPLTGAAVTDARVIGAIAGMNDIAQAARDGDSSRVQTLFYTQDAHNLTHDLGPVLQNSAPEVSRRLCEQVVGLEEQMAKGVVDTQAVVARAEAVAAILEEARAFISETATSVPGAAGVCGQALAAISGESLTEVRFRTAIDGMRETGRLAATDEQGAAEVAFFGEAHNITHDVDTPLREVDSELAINLCLSVLAIEQAFGGTYDPSVVEREATAAAQLLEDAGRALGIIQ